jgi:hypothetical protein
LFIRSTRPFACGLLAQMRSMLSSVSARPNCVTPRAPTGCAVVVDAENAVLVAVERDRLAVALQVRAGRREVVERGLDLDEAHLHQAPSGVVDVNQQRAHRATLLEPSVLATVDLHQLAQALAPVPRLVRLAQSLVSRQPEPCERHPLAERFLGHPNVVELE